MVWGKIIKYNVVSVPLTRSLLNIKQTVFGAFMTDFCRVYNLISSYLPKKMSVSLIYNDFFIYIYRGIALWRLLVYFSMWLGSSMSCCLLYYVENLCHPSLVVTFVLFFFKIFCSIFSTNYYEDWNMYTQLTSCIEISNRAICLWMLIATLRLGTLAWLELHLKQISWLNMLSLGGTGHLSCSSTVQSTLLQLISGLLLAFLVK